MDNKTVISIEVKFSDGTMLRAAGELAQAVWKWWRSCEGLAWAHGSRYTGESPEPPTGEPGK